MLQNNDLPLVSVVVPVFQNAGSLDDLFDRLRAVAADTAAVQWEFVFVDDGSTDGSAGKLEALLARDARIRIVCLSRNFGSQAAVLAGLTQARGEAAAVISADLQDPPELLATLVAHWRAGRKVVLAARARRSDPWLATSGATIFYWLIRRLALANMPAGGFDFCLLDRQVVDQLRLLKRPVFLAGEILWLGFNPAIVYYERGRRLARYGRSMWTLGKRVRLAADAIWSFSRAPLRLLHGLGWTLISLAAAALTVQLARGEVRSGHDVWLPIVAGCSGLQLLGLGWVGDYVWGCQQSLAARPPFIIDEVMETVECPPSDRAALIR